MQYSILSTEKDLIKGCLSEDRTAQKYLYKKYYSQMLGICMRYTKNHEEAVEVLNDSFLKIFRDINKYRGTGALGAWIRKIVLYTSIDFIRSNNHFKNTISLESARECEVESDAIDRISAQELMEIIQKVSPASQGVFSLYAIEGYTHKEIAEILGISIGTSKWHLSNARKELQFMLRQTGNYLIAL